MFYPVEAQQILEGGLNISEKLRGWPEKRSAISMHDAAMIVGQRWNQPQWLARR
jgi:hypothetical protein